MKEKIKFITFTQAAMISLTYKVLLERKGDQKKRKKTPDPFLLLLLV